MKNFDDNKNYQEFNVDEVKVFIHKSIQIKDNIEIKQSFSLPLLGNGFKVKGIKIEQKL